MAPAIALADGFPMYEFLRDYLQSERKASEPYEWSIRTYYPDGKITPVGEMFRQPNLAATLRALVAAEAQARSGGATREQAIQAGRDAFYKGSIAKRMTAAVRAAGGVMTDDDLASYRGKIEEPATVPYRGYTVHKAGFWNQGPALLQTLRILEGFDLAKMGQRIRRRDSHDRRSDQACVRGSGPLLRGSGFRAACRAPALLSADYAAVRRALDRSRARQHRASSG